MDCHADPLYMLNYKQITLLKHRSFVLDLVMKFQKEDQNKLQLWQNMLNLIDSTEVLSKEEIDAMDNRLHKIRSAHFIQKTTSNIRSENDENGTSSHHDRNHPSNHRSRRSRSKSPIRHHRWAPRDRSSDRHERKRSRSRSRKRPRHELDRHHHSREIAKSPFRSGSFHRSRRDEPHTSRDNGRKQISHHSKSRKSRSRSPERKLDKQPPRKRSRSKSRVENVKLKHTDASSSASSTILASDLRTMLLERTVNKFKSTYSKSRDGVTQEPKLEPKIDQNSAGKMILSNLGICKLRQSVSVDPVETIDLTNNSSDDAKIAEIIKKLKKQEFQKKVKPESTNIRKRLEILRAEKNETRYSKTTDQLNSRTSNLENFEKFRKNEAETRDPRIQKQIQRRMSVHEPNITLDRRFSNVPETQSSADRMVGSNLKGNMDASSICTQTKIFKRRQSVSGASRDIIRFNDAREINHLTYHITPSTREIQTPIRANNQMEIDQIENIEAIRDPRIQKQRRQSMCVDSNEIKISRPMPVSAAATSKSNLSHIASSSKFSNVSETNPVSENKKEVQQVGETKISHGKKSIISSQKSSLELQIKSDDALKKDKSEIANKTSKVFKRQQTEASNKFLQTSKTRTKGAPDLASRNSLDVNCHPKFFENSESFKASDAFKDFKIPRKTNDKSTVPKKAPAILKNTEIPKKNEKASSTSDKLETKSENRHSNSKKSNGNKVFKVPRISKKVEAMDVKISEKLETNTSDDDKGLLQKRKIETGETPLIKNASDNQKKSRKGPKKKNRELDGLHDLISNYFNADSIVHAAPKRACTIRKSYTEEGMLISQMDNVREFTIYMEKLPEMNIKDKEILKNYELHQFLRREKLQVECADTPQHIVQVNTVKKTQKRKSSWSRGIIQRKAAKGPNDSWEDVNEETSRCESEDILTAKEFIDFLNSVDNVGMEIESNFEPTISEHLQKSSLIVENLAYFHCRLGVRFQCRICWFQNSDKTTIVQHLITHCETCWNGTCSICSMESSEVQSLQDEFEHLLSHLEQKNCDSRVNSNDDKDESTIDNSFSNGHNTAQDVKMQDPCDNIQPQQIKMETLDDNEAAQSSKTYQCGVVPNLKEWNVKSWSDGTKTKITNEFCISSKRLASLFKCMDRYCAFYTNRKEFFTQHLFYHTRNQSLCSDFLNCSYCDFKASEAKKLTEHVQNIHGKSSLQCGYCYFRAFSFFQVTHHQKHFHQGLEQKILKCLDCPNALPDLQIIRQDLKTKWMRPYICPAPKCGYKDFIRQNFEEHIKTHPKTSFKCRICEQHCNISKTTEHQVDCSKRMDFTCVYCGFTSETQIIMNRHFEINHLDSIPLFCKRELKPQQRPEQKICVSSNDLVIKKIQYVYHGEMKLEQVQGEENENEMFNVGFETTEF